MFGSLAFMVNRKMCLAVGAKGVMFSIDSQIYEREVKKLDARQRHWEERATRVKL